MLALFFILAAGPDNFALDAQKSVVKYHIVHKLHTVDAEAHGGEGRAVVQPDGTVMLMVRAQVQQFHSGEGNRDEHMQEVVEANKYPYVTLKGTFKLERPAQFPATQQVSVQSEIDFHGVKHQQQTPVTLKWMSPTQVEVTSTFSISLDAYKIERPSLLLVKIDDACRIDVDAWFSKQ